MLHSGRGISMDVRVKTKCTRAKCRRENAIVIVHLSLISYHPASTLGHLEGTKRMWLALVDDLGGLSTCFDVGRSRTGCQRT